MFVSFEGIEGCGKTTLIAAVERAVQRQGSAAVCCVHEPGGTPVGTAIRRIFLEPEIEMGALSEALLINASRAQLVEAVIRPALARGSTVLCDRYVHSTIAYQGYGGGLALDLVRSLCDAATGGLMPDLTFFIDVSVATSRARVAARGDGRDRVELRNAEFYERVRNGFIEMSQRDERVLRIDGERSEAEVLDAALAAMSALSS